MDKEFVIGGAITTRSLLEAYKHLGAAVPLAALINNVTANGLFRQMTQPCSTVEPWHNFTMPRRNPSDPTATLFVTVNRNNVVNRAVHIFASDGQLYIFRFDES